MNMWTNEEIQEIFIQLDRQRLPFAKYAFTGLDEGLHLLGKGGFALVYEACSRKKKKKNFAIKVIGFGDKHVDSAFFRESVEVQEELGLGGRNVVRVFDYAEILLQIEEREGHISVSVQQESAAMAGGNILRLQFIVMEKIEPVITMDSSGKPHLQPARLAEFCEDEILNLAFDIGNALVRAHEKNVLHRDVKLENIFYSPKDKHYKLGDFGIAKKTDDKMASTVTFTKGYGAPEVVGSLDAKYDDTADIYSFGMLLYVLVNKLRFPDSNNYHVNLTAQYRRGYQLPRAEGCSDGFWGILDKMCRFDPDERYQSMKAVMEDFDRLIFNPVVQYKKKHNAATGMLSIFFFLSGVITAAVTFPNSWNHLSYEQGLWEYTWIPVTLLLLFFVFINLYCIIKNNEPKYLRLYFSNHKYYIWICIVNCVVSSGGAVLKYGHSNLLEAICGKEGYDILCRIDFIKVGLVANTVLILWKLREKIMIRRKDV